MPIMIEKLKPLRPGAMRDNIDLRVPLPRAIHRSLKAAAAAHGLTLAQVIQAVLAEAVKTAVEAGK